MLAGYTIPPKKKLDPIAYQLLADAYEAITGGKKKCPNNPWTYEEVVHLGALFCRLHGRTPKHKELRRDYFQPEPCVITRLFGTYKHYTKVIQEEACPV